MPKFLVMYHKGQAYLRGGSVDFERQPGRHQLELTASDKLSAFAEAVEHFARIGLNVSVEVDKDGRNSLGFDDEQLSELNERGRPLSTTPTTGIRIDKIIPAI